MNWACNGLDVTEVPADIPFGFIYQLTYEDGKQYIGKKNFYTIQKLPALKSGEVRPGATRTYKNGSGTRKYYDLLPKETKWKDYEGSHEKPKSPLVSKEIIAFAETKRELTYLEVKALFHFDVLEDDNYLNQNILAVFYKNNLK